MRYSSFGLLLGLAVLLGACGDDASSSTGYDQISTWLVELCEEDPAVRADAARSLGQAWPESARSVPVLAEALEDEDAAVRAAAAASLEALALRGVDPIVAFLRDEDDPARRALAKTLERILSLGAKVAPKDLAQYMTEEPRGGIVFMGLGTGTRHPLIPPSRVNRSLLGFLGYCADARSTPRLGIDDPKWPEVASSVCSIDGMLALGSPGDREAPPGCVALADEEDPVLATFGSMLLQTWGAEAWPRPGGPLPVAKPFDDLLRELRELPSDSPRGFHDLVRGISNAARDLEPGQRGEIAEVLIQRWPPVGEGSLRREVIHLLGVLGEDAAVAVPRLRRELEEAEAVWQGYLIEGGETSRPGDIVALFVEYGATLDVTFANRLFLTDTLGDIGPAAEEAIPLLEGLVVEGDPTLAYLAARSLREIRAD